MKRDKVHVILLAAGASSRMEGRDKLIESLEGQPLLRRSTSAAVSSMANAVHVVIPLGNPNRRRVIEDLNVNILENSHPDLGISSSIRCGVNGLPHGTGAVIITPADMPDISSSDYNSLIQRWRSDDLICRATTELGEPGHPVLFPNRYFPRLIQLTGDAGAKSLLETESSKIHLVATRGQSARTDLDTPEDWESRRSQP